MQPIKQSLVRMTTAVALASALLVALLPPAAFFYFGNRYHIGHLTAQVYFTARRISQLASRNPDMWRFEAPRLEDALAATEIDDELESKRLVGVEGDLIAQSGYVDGPLPWPVVRLSEPVYDSGRVVAHLRTAHSLRGLFLKSSLLGLVTLLLGIGVFYVMRTWPLRAMARALDRAAFLASHDVLTQLPNRMLFNNWLKHRMAESDRGGEAVAILCLDLDHFKEVNDTLGHAAGDRLLQQAVERMKGEIRESDMLARLGGDEFAIIQSDACQPDGAALLAQRIIEILSRTFQVDGHDIVIGTSIGISIHKPGCDADPSLMLQQGDTALYSAKNAERGTFRFFEEEMNRSLVERKHLEAALRKAILDDDFELHYQPQVDLASGRIIGVEALLRWEHPELGNIGPDRFIPLAEATNLMQPLGQWVLEEACRQAVLWPGLQMAVNVSPLQFRQDDFVDMVRRALEVSTLEPERLQLEITEGILLHDTTATLAVLNTLRDLGVRIVMDDFGTGYSSIGYLRRFPFSKIKIDKSFVRDLGQDGSADSIVDAVIGLGNSLGMQVNAEGVETREQVERLNALGCEEVQGYHFGRPMPSGDIDLLLGHGISDPAAVRTGSERLVAAAD